MCCLCQEVEFSNNLPTEEWRNACWDLTKNGTFDSLVYWRDIEDIYEALPDDNKRKIFFEMLIRINEVAEAQKGFIIHAFKGIKNNDFSELKQFVTKNEFHLRHALDHPDIDKTILIDPVYADEIIKEEWEKMMK